MRDLEVGGGPARPDRRRLGRRGGGGCRGGGAAGASARPPVRHPPRRRRRARPGLWKCRGRREKSQKGAASAVWRPLGTAAVAGGGGSIARLLVAPNGRAARPRLPRAAAAR
ncbi:hypothetical protein Rsub_09503 [Raphidocelis subcapitata]|uniref:Uncharacterized protein n=1 Tax=Raphidocelis subcapitata TaxID=307507 RepID=A0A2V0PGJ6_9CHLO|nr:hypothetical protein Rsub_09503 [Raphidocelis subcapitata]|eukprot:GBF97030.1 hypothetical protein Rsub_09503 [Raphidocelis subcapitata]